MEGYENNNWQNETVNNTSDNVQQESGNGSYQWGPVTSPQQEEPDDKNKKHKKKGLGKRILAITLSAVLFGGISGGVMAGVVYGAGAVDQLKTASEKKQKENRTVLNTSMPVANDNTGTGTIDVSTIVESTMPSIVSITNLSVQVVQQYMDLFGRGPIVQEQEVEQRGSGIIIGKNDEELLIVTNNHVVADSSTLSVGFVDEQVYEAVVKGMDAENDLAVIAVQLSALSDETLDAIKIAQVGDSDALKVGEQVIAIGNALGYGQSVTTGIVSAVNRQIGETESENGFIQTDAAINPGNSGGALLNMKGELIGINSAKMAAEQIEGMGYAIPVTTASPIIENLMNRKTREKVDEDKAAVIGISGQNVDANVSEVYGIPQGVVVAEVHEGGAAEKAGMQPGCVITAFDGQGITSMSELKNLLTYYEAGETVEITIQVANQGEYVEKVLEITLDPAPQKEKK